MFLSKIKDNYLYYLCTAALFINLAFPKAGFYIGNIPITFGYVVLGMTSFVIFIDFLIKRYSLTNYEFIQISGILLFFCLNMVICCINGFDVKKEFLFAYLVSIGVIPICAILLNGFFLKISNLEFQYKLFKLSFYIVVIWGIMNFLGINFLHYSLNIPFLTITGSDVNIYLSKCNFRAIGNIVKAFSTYNNGNILGINVLIWFPFVLYAKKIPLFMHFLARLLLLLTLSRTVWAGLIAMEILLFLFYEEITSKNFLKLFFKLFFITVFIIIFTYLFLDNPVTFVFDKSLGGRIEQFDHVVSYVTFFSHYSFSVIREIVYVSMLKNLGIFGLVFFIVVYSFPLFINPKFKEDILVKIGLILYFFVMLSDGAFILIPTQFTYWTMVTFLLGSKLERNVIH